VRREFAAATATSLGVPGGHATTNRELNRRRFHAARDHATLTLLRDLVRAGMEPSAVPRAAELIVAMDEEARVLRELDRERLRA
jgi:hypothetical protein